MKNIYDKFINSIKLLYGIYLFYFFKSDFGVSHMFPFYDGNHALHPQFLQHSILGLNGSGTCLKSIQNWIASIPKSDVLQAIPYQIIEIISKIISIYSFKEI